MLTSVLQIAPMLSSVVRVLFGVYLENVLNLPQTYAMGVRRKLLL